MELTIEEKTIIVNLLNQISIPVSQAPRVLEIINKLQSEDKGEKPKEK